MNLAEDLSVIYAKLQAALNDANAKLIDKGGSEAVDISNIAEKIKNIPSYEYAKGIIDGTGTDIEIHGVSSIRPYAFYFHDRMVNVTFSEDVTEIRGNSVINCNSLSKVLIKNPNLKMYMNSFASCSNLVEFIVSEGHNNNLYLLSVSSISSDSLHNIIENLNDRSTSTACYFRVGETNLAKIDDEHIAILESKNWNYS